MHPPDTRAAVGELAADLGWLEDHCRAQPGLAAHAGSLRLASALTRNVLGPFLEDQPARPLHVAVVGGAGAGKSTVVNFLCGSVVAEANPQAGFTRHPTAFLPADGAALPSTVGFLGPMRRVSEEKPADLDEDVYQVRRLQPGPGTDALAEFVVWDCPDMTTWASSGYVARLMEVAALADVVVYVASDERYNDEVPTQFLHLAVKAGKAVVCVLTKMREADAPAMVEHFRQEVLGRLPPLPGGAQPAVPVVPFPQMPPDVRNDPGGAGAKYRVQLLNQILVQCESADASRARTVTNAARYLATAGEGLLDVARRDLAEFEAWKGAVQGGRLAFEERYRQEYLSGEQFRRFDRYREQLVELVELPGAGRMWGNVLWVLRAPYRWGRDTLTRLIVRPDVLNLSEKTVLDAALVGWLDGLRAEALRRAASHPVWKAAARGFDGPLAAEARDRFQQAFRTFELKETDDLETTGRQLVAHLEGNPALLYGLRGGKLAADVVVVGAATTWVVLSPQVSWLMLLVLIPLGVSATHQTAELVARGAAEAARLKVRSHREALVSEMLTAPLAAWLAEWPATGGSAFEKLQQVLGRVPRLIKQLEERVAAKLSK